MNYEVKEVLKSIEVIESSKELTSELRKTFATDFPMIKACVKENLITFSDLCFHLIRSLTSD